MTDAPLPDASVPISHPSDRPVFGQVHLTRAMIFASACLCAFLFYCAARFIHWPDEPGFRGSMGQPKVALGGFLVAILLLAVCTVLGTLIAGRRWFMAGLMAATAGMTTWSVRGGNMTQVLFNADNSGAGAAVFVQLIVELIVLFAVIGGLWNWLWSMSGTRVVNGEVTAESRARQAERFRRLRYVPGTFVMRIAVRSFSETGQGDEEGRTTAGALLAQTAIMAALLLIFTVTPLKKQVLTSVFVSSLIATAIAEYFFADRKAGRWYWIAPLAVGVAGYATGYCSPAGLATGDLQGMFAPLTRILPLDYASMGCAGVLFGYWWMDPDPAAEAPSPQADAPAAE